MTALEEIFDTVAVPNWLLDFYSDSLEAVDAALWGRYYFGHLNVAEPSDLLIDWALGIGDQEDFVPRLDEALAQWIERNWGKQPEVQGMRSATATALAWIQLGEIVANVTELKQAGRVLCERFEDRQAYLGSLCQGPSRDPLGSYLYAVARYQEDRLLLPTWWSYCDLITGIPWYHGIYGIWGLRGLPPLPDERGRMSEQVISALPRLAVGLYKRSLDRSINLSEAKAEFERIVSLVQLAYPFANRWHSYWAAQVDALRMRGEPIEEPTKWLGRFVPGLDRPRPTRRERERMADLMPSPHWSNDANRIAEQLRRNAREAIQEAENLIKQQRQYAEKTGDSYYVCRTLVRFASVVSANYSHEAVEWAEEARLWEPWNAYTWTILTQAVRRDSTSNSNEVLSIAWETVERFPEDVVAHTGLAEVLKEAGRLTEAEAVYRETTQRFPENVYAYNGLAQVLRDIERLAEAEALYRETTQRFPEDVYAYNGLAQVLRDIERLAEAEALYRETTQRFPEDVYAYNGLAQVLRDTGRLAEAEALYRETTQRFPEDVYAYNGLAQVLRDTGRLAEAEALYRETTQRFPEDVYAYIGLAEVLQETGRLAEARALYRKTVQRFPKDVYARLPKDVYVRNSLAQVLRDIGRLAEAEVAYRETTQHFPEDVYAYNGLAQVLRDIGRLAEAEVAYRETTQHFPEDVYAYNGLAQVLRDTGRLAEAEALYRETMQRFPKNIYARNGLAQVLRDIGRLAGAEALYRETMQRFPENVYARNGLAQVLRDIGRLAEAEALYRETMQRFPKDVYARNGLAEVLQETERLAEAEALYRETTQRFPKNVYARVGLAMLRLRSKVGGNEALELVNQAVKLEPSNVDTLMAKARILEQLGRMTEAREVLAYSHASASSSVSLLRPEGEIKSDIDREVKFHIGRKEAIAISAYARFLRRWARRPDTTGRRPDSSQLRADALTMLDQLITALPYQTKARAEKALLLSEAGQAEEARSFLVGSIKLFPNDPALRYALGRVERDIAQLEARRLDEVSLDTVTAVWHRLRQSNPASRPLESLGSGRAWLAHLDGQIVRGQALKSFAAVRQWMSPYLDLISEETEPASDEPENIRRRYRESSGFEQWWSREMQAYLFGPIDISLELQDKHMDVIEKRLKQYTLPVDTLEEDLTVRLSL